MASANIEHPGIIESISPQKLRIRFTSVSACAACHAKGACSAADIQEKSVEVDKTPGDFSLGETVNIILAPSQGFEALLIGYVYPFLLVFASLIILTLSEISELKAGLISLALLVPYYLIVYSLRKKINKKFQFSIRKLQ